MIEIVTTGNLLDDDAQALVNPVNTIGVVGSKLTRRFKRRFPQMYSDYRSRARSGGIRIGEMLVWQDPSGAGPIIINFPIKQHWIRDSHLSYIQSRLDALTETVEALDIGSIAMPALGCGLGGLAWNDVLPQIERAFQGLPDVDVRVYHVRDHLQLMQESHW